MLILGIETSTPQTGVALGNDGGLVASAVISSTRANHEVVVPTVTELLRWTDLRPGGLTGIAVGLGPGLFTGMRVGIARRRICAAMDARRREVFYAFYRPVPGGVTRETGFEAASPATLAAELEAQGEDVLVVGNGALVYRRVLEEAGSHVEIASAAHAFPAAAALVELAVPRFQREEFDRVYDLQPIYLRKSDAEIAWDQRRRGA